MICGKCGSGNVTVEPIMHGSTHSDGEPLVYWRCKDCRAISSRLTHKPIGEPADASTSGAH
jgi:hypothetical protein